MRVIRLATILFCLCFSATSLFALEEHLVLTDQTIDTGTVIEAATETITAGPNYLITGDAEVVFAAGTEIYLNPGFCVTVGAMFTATTDLLINEELTEDTTFEGTHYICETLTVPTGIRLTVNEGARIMFAADSESTLLIGGELNAINATFTSTTEIPGSWNGIRILNMGTGSLSGSTIEYARQGVMVDSGSSVTLLSCLFYKNLVGLHVLGMAPWVTGNRFDSNLWYGVKEELQASACLRNNIFHDNGHLYYHRSLTNLSIDALNNIEGNYGNTEE
jgi:hypothetical protein